jgi:hypothetical protein
MRQICRFFWVFFYCVVGAVKDHQTEWMKISSCNVVSMTESSPALQVGSQMELACRSCQQQLWGKSPSATRALPTQALAAEIPSLFTQDKLGELKDDHKDTHAIKLRSTQWMQDQLNDCLL